MKLVVVIMVVVEVEVEVVMTMMVMMVVLATVSEVPVIVTFLMMAVDSTSASYRLLRLLRQNFHVLGDKAKRAHEVGNQIAAARPSGGATVKRLTHTTHCTWHRNTFV